MRQRSHRERVSISLICAALGMCGCRSGGGPESVNSDEVARGHFERGRQLIANGNQRGAVDAWRTAIAVAPSHPAPYFAIAAVHESAGQLDEAMRILEALKRAGTAEKHLDCRRAELFLTGNRWFRAYQAASSALRSTPECPLAHTVMGSIHSSAGDKKSATAHIARAYRAAPQNPRLALSYVQALAESGSGGAALEIAKALPKDVKDSVNGLYVQGCLHRRVSPRDKPGAAEDYLTASLRLDPEHKRSLIEMGLLMRDRGDLRSARDYLMRGTKDIASTEALSALAEVETALKLQTAESVRKRSADVSGRDAEIRLARAKYLKGPGEKENILRLARLESEMGNRKDAVELISEVLKQDPDDVEALNEMHRLTTPPG